MKKGNNKQNKTYYYTIQASSRQKKYTTWDTCAHRTVSLYIDSQRAPVNFILNTQTSVAITLD